MDGEIMRIVAKILSKIASVMNYISMATCFLMMLLMTADVVCRYVFKSSILGTYEIAENMLAVVVAFSFADCQVRKGHIHVDILTNALPYRIQKICEVITMAICVVFMYYASVSQVKQVIAVHSSGLASTVLQFKIWPFQVALAGGMIVLGIAFLADFVTALIDLFSPKHEDNGSVETA